MSKYIYDDGGREKAGFKGKTNDCVIRAIAIATKIDYKVVYNEISKLQGKGKSPRTGVNRDIYEPYLKSLGYEWFPKMKVGQGCKTHLNKRELPGGILIVKIAKHLTTVKNGTIYDTFDCSKSGKACVYGYYKKIESPKEKDIEYIKLYKDEIPAAAYSQYKEFKNCIVENENSNDEYLVFYTINKNSFNQ